MAISIVLLRRGKDIKILIWLAAWSGSFGIRALIESQSVKIILPQFTQSIIPSIDVIISLMILVFALLTWLYLVRGRVRTIVIIIIAAASIVAVLGIAWFFVTGSAQTFMNLNNLIAAISIIFFAVLLIQKKLSDKYLNLPNRGVLATGSVIFLAEALYTNLSNLIGYEAYIITSWLGFAVLILAMTYTAAKMIFVNERRLITIESEMETARQIQSYILPERFPKLNGLHVASAYHPMTEVAGDFYDFIKIDQNKTGFLIADVSGHGVPAALIASMIKVAMQSVVDTANDPGEVLRRLSKILREQLQEQFVTAAYLYVDLETCQARYSAAGHPPLIYWDSDAQQTSFIESNGLIFSFLKQSDYPVREIEFKAGDRFLLYTDGLTEAENPDGESFDNKHLDELIHANKHTSALEFSSNILNAIRLWQSNKMSQQDDLTWIVVDIL